MDNISLYTLITFVFFGVLHIAIVSSMHLSKFAHSQQPDQSKPEVDTRKLAIYAHQFADNPFDQRHHRIRHYRAKRSHRRSLPDPTNATNSSNLSNHNQTTSGDSQMDNSLTITPLNTYTTKTDDLMDQTIAITYPNKSHQDHIATVSLATVTPVLSRKEAFRETSINDEQSKQTSLQAKFTMVEPGSVTETITNSLPEQTNRISQQPEFQHTRSSFDHVTSPMEIADNPDVLITSPPIAYINGDDNGTSENKEQVVSMATESVVMANVVTTKAQTTEERPPLIAGQTEVPGTSSPLTAAGDENQLITGRHNTHHSRVTSSDPLPTLLNANSLTESDTKGARLPTSQITPGQLDLTEGQFKDQATETSFIETTAAMLFGDNEDQITTQRSFENPDVVTSPPDVNPLVTRHINETGVMTSLQSDDNMFVDETHEKSLTHTTEMSSLDHHMDNELQQTTPRVSDTQSTESVHMPIVINNTISSAQSTFDSESLPGIESGKLSENVTQSSVNQNQNRGVTTIKDINTSILRDTTMEEIFGEGSIGSNGLDAMTTDVAMETSVSELTTEFKAIDATSHQTSLSKENNYSASANTTVKLSLGESTTLLSVITTSDNRDTTSWFESEDDTDDQRHLTSLSATQKSEVTEQALTKNSSHIYETATIDNAHNLTLLSTTLPPFIDPTLKSTPPPNSVRYSPAYWDKLWLFILISCCVLAVTLLVFLLALVIFFTARRRRKSRRRRSKKSRGGLFYHYHYPRKSHPFTDSDLMYSTEVGNVSEGEEMTFGTFGKTRGRDRIMLNGSSEKIMHPFIAPGVDFVRIKTCPPIQTNGSTKAEYV